MRIPFLKKNLIVTEERFNHIKDNLGSCSGEFAGAIFWLVAFFIPYLTDNNQIIINFYIFGGIFIIPLASSLILKLLGGRAEVNQYSFLIIISNMIFALMYPISLIISNYNINLLPSTIAIINGVHLLIFMWVHYEFLYLILSLLYELLGILFVFYLSEFAFTGVPVISMLLNPVFGYLIYKSAKDTLKGYNIRVISHNR